MVAALSISIGALAEASLPLGVLPVPVEQVGLVGVGALDLPGLGQVESLLRPVWVFSFGIINSPLSLICFGLSFLLLGLLLGSFTALTERVIDMKRRLQLGVLVHHRNVGTLLSKLHEQVPANLGVAISRPRTEWKPSTGCPRPETSGHCGASH